MDLDNFSKCIEEKNWTEYTPNPITREMNYQVEALLRRHLGTELWGLDKKRGTEECILTFNKSPGDIVSDLEEIKITIYEVAQKHNAPTSLSIGVSYGTISRYKPLQNAKSSSLKKYPVIFSAYKAMKEAKKRGGNKIVQY